MTEQNQISLPDEVLNTILTGGLDGLPEAVSLLINHAMLIERHRHLGAAPYERCPARNGQANGFKKRSLDTRLGSLELFVPQVRRSDQPFYPSALERGQRSERALVVAIAEMYLQGVSTRRVTKILQELCGLEITSTQVSRAAADLDAMLEAWRQRPIPPVSHLILDARYEKVRVNGVVRSCAVLTAIGIRREDGRRMILGVSVSLSEAEVHWREFLASLQARGLHTCSSITSDAHEGLKAAITSIYPGVPGNRCQFHLQQNAQAYVPKQSMKESVAPTSAPSSTPKIYARPRPNWPPPSRNTPAALPSSPLGWKPTCRRASTSLPSPSPSANACAPPTSARRSTNKSVAAPASLPSFPTPKAACA
jgi:transposase-like protein